jgi:hypothetical protein
MPPHMMRSKPGRVPWQREGDYRELEKARVGVQGEEEALKRLALNARLKNSDWHN